MTNFTGRFIAFNIMWVSILFPVYLAVRFSLPELGLLCVPITSWWFAKIWETIEDALSSRGQDVQP